MLDDVLQPNLFVLLFILYWLGQFLVSQRQSSGQGFRRLSLRFHPERAARAVADQSDEEAEAREEEKAAFAIVAEAYEVLSDPFKRAVFDQYGEAGLKKTDRPPDDCIPPYVFHGDPLRTYREFFGTDNPYADLLDNLKKPPLLGDCPEARGEKTKDDDVIKPLRLTLSEVFHGGVKKQKIQRMVLSGVACGGPPRTAPEEKILSVPIMPGMPTGTRIVFPEEGDQGPMKIPADVVFITEDEPHETFHRDGANLRMTVRVFLREALTGMIVAVDTIDGRTLRVPITSVITPEYVKRVPGEGLPRVEEPERRGDLIIRFDVEFPLYMPKSSKMFVQKAFDKRQQMPDDDEDDHEEREKRRLPSRRILLDGKLYVRANKISEICRP